MPTDLGTFSFLWERSANTDFSDTPVTLQDSTSTTYLLTDEDAAAFIRVTVSYTDGGGFPETITSAVRQTATLPDREPTGAPVITGTTEAGQTLTVTTDTITDANGLGTFSFLWERSANTDFSDTPVTLQDSASTTYLLTDDDANQFIRVTVSYTDGGGFPETITSAVRQTETLPDREPTGAPVITGTTEAGQTLTVTTDTIGDANGLGTFTFLWERSANTDFSDTPVTLQDSASTTYLLTDDDANQFIRVTVSYTDGGGFSETITSAVRQISHATRPRTHRRTGHHRHHRSGSNPHRHYRYHHRCQRT